MPMVKTVVVDLSPFPLIDSIFHYTNPGIILPRSSFIVHRPRRALSLRHENRRLSTFTPTFSASNTLVQQFAAETDSDVHYDASEYTEIDIFNFDDTFGSIDMKPLNSPVLEVKELDELPEQWRRSKLAWLCKELPSHKGTTLTRILNAQRKWVRQEDATYLAFHCLRIRENETSFRVCKWMMEQHWFRFDFALATKLADYMGKERKSGKCREIFDDIINQGRVPNESTFHILIVSYLSSQDKSYIQESCKIYKRMIQLGNYKPRLSLHNSLFRSLVSKTGNSCKQYLKEAEFIYHNLTTSGLQVHRDIYSGLIWIHSYQDSVDKERISSLRSEMKREGFKESQEIRLSILRVCAKEGDVHEAERIYESSLPSKAIVYKIEAYANAGQPLKALEIFKGTKMTKTVSAYHKIIEILCRADEVELAESVMEEFVDTGLKPLMPSFIVLMNMFLKLDLHDKLELTFLWSVEACRPNRTIYNIYLDSLVRIGNVRKVEDIFSQMINTDGVGVNNRSCNFLLGCYLSNGECDKAEKMYVLMCQKKYDVDPSHKEKIEYNRSLVQKIIEKTPVKLNLSVEQREILLGLLLGGLRMEFNEERKDHRVVFEFNENHGAHVKGRIHDEFQEWLAPANMLLNGDDNDNDNDNVPNSFRTVSHVAFSFYAEQFWPNGRPGIPKLIHRWLSPRVLAYWYMFGGYKTSSGDLLLMLKGAGKVEEDVERVVKGLKARSLVCKVKRKGRVHWLGFLGENAKRLWETIEPYVVVRDERSSIINFDRLADSDGLFSDYSDHDES